MLLLFANTATCSCVHHAAEYGHLDAIKLMQELMGMDIDIDAPDRHQWYCTRDVCARTGSTSLGGAESRDVTQEPPHFPHPPRTPLFNAASNGHVEVIRHLAKAGASVNNLSERGRTPLHM